MLLKAAICMCCGGYALRTLRVRGIFGPAVLLLKAVICMCCSGYALRTLRVRGISGPTVMLLKVVIWMWCSGHALRTLRVRGNHSYPDRNAVMLLMAVIWRCSTYLEILFLEAFRVCFAFCGHFCGLISCNELSVYFNPGKCCLASFFYC